MIRAVLLCALVICAQGVDVSGPNVKYAQRARSLRKGVEQLEADVKTTVLTFNEYLQYILLVGVVLETVKEVNLQGSSADVTTILIRVLETKVPDILEKPKDTVDDLYGLVDDTLYLADPVLKVIDDVCEGSADAQCNRVVEKLVQSDTKLRDSANVLDAAGQVTDAYLAKQPRLKEVANNFQVIPYLLQNKEPVKDFVDLQTHLIYTIYPDKNRTN